MSDYQTCKCRATSTISQIKSLKLLIICSSDVATQNRAGATLVELTVSDVGRAASFAAWRRASTAVARWSHGGYPQRDGAPAPTADRRATTSAVVGASQQYS